MRVLSTVTGSHGHARAVLPLVRALAAAGHEVVVALSPHLADVFAGSGARAEPVLPDFIEAMQEMRTLRQTVFPELLGPDGVVDVRMQMIGFAAGPQVSSAFRAILPIADAFGPELVLRDGGELAGCLIAEKLDIPHISAPSGAGNLIDADGAAWLLDERRGELGLPIKSDPMSIYRYGRIDCMPTEFSFGAFRMPEPFAYSQPLLVGDGETLPEPFAALSGDRPLVVAAVGTALPVVLGMKLGGIEAPEEMLDPADTLRAIAGGLSLLDCHGVVATGGLPVEGIETGPNVQVVDFVPQPLLLQCTQLFLTHGGYNSIREAVRAGVPMALLPQFSDQHHNADRVAELGLGARVRDISAEGIARTCRELLVDEKVAATTRTAHRRMLGLPGIGAAIAHIESLVDKGNEVSR